MSARRVLGACVRFKGVHNLIPAPRAVSRWQGRSPAVLKPTSCRHQAASARAHSTAPASALAGVEAREADGTLVVSWSDGAAAGFHAEWLRDHCQCAGCFDHRTLQRRTDIAAWGDADGRPCSHLSAAQVHDAEDAAGVMVDGPGAAAASMELQEAAAAAVARGGTNFVTATVGGGAAAHRVVLSGSFLRRHAYWPVNDAAKRAGFDTGAWERDAEDMRKALPLESFGADSFAAGAGLPSLTVEELKSAENGVFRLLRDLHVHGIVAVTGVAPTVEATEEVVRCISFPSATLYGSGMWLTEIRDGGDIDTAYTADGLPPHTDGTYFGDMPGKRRRRSSTCSSSADTPGRAQQECKCSILSLTTFHGERHCSLMGCGCARFCGSTIPRRLSSSRLPLCRSASETTLTT